MNDMSKGDKVYVSSVGIVLVLVWALVWPDVKPPENTESLRFENSVIRVDANAAIEWGVDLDALEGWGVPVELVDHDADVVFEVGPTRSQVVPGFGTLYVAGQAQKVPNRDNWIEQCTITLSDRNRPAAEDATAIAVHEFGHCLGMEHNDAEESIMSTVMHSELVPNPLFAYAPTDHDRQALSARLAPSTSTRKS